MQHLKERIYAAFKGNVQFIFLCNPQKSGALRVCITFLQITQQIPISVARGIMRHLALRLNITPERTGHNA